MLQNAYFLAKIGADTAENEQHFAEILPKFGNYPTGWTESAGQAQAGWTEESAGRSRASGVRASRRRRVGVDRCQFGVGMDLPLPRSS